MALFTKGTIRHNTLTLGATDLSCAQAREIADRIVRDSGNVSYVSDETAARSLAGALGYGTTHTVFFESAPDPATMHHFLWLERHHVGVKAHGAERLIEFAYSDNLPASDVEMIRLNSTKKANGYVTRSVCSESEARRHFANMSGEQKVAYDWTAEPAETFTVKTFQWNAATRSHCTTVVGTRLTQAQVSALDLSGFARVSYEPILRNGSSYASVVRNRS